MRGFAWYHVLFLVPIVGLAFGIQHIVRKRSAGETHPETVAIVEKPSHFHQEGKSDETEVEAKVVAGVKKKEKHIEVESEPENFEAALDATLKESRKPASVFNQHGAKQNVAKQNVVVKLDAPASHDLSCSAAEFKGDGPLALIKIDEWELVMGHYADVKRRLLGWLEKNRKEFPEKTASFMERQILSARLVRLPVASAPDLAWRGIGVLAYDGTIPVVQLGTGFVKLAKREPERAKFELARLVAQSLAPCEMKRNQFGETWTSLLLCLQVNEPNGCAPGSFSEAGWAVSTTIASAVSVSSCPIPAFKNPEIARCMTKMQFLPGGAKTLWKESRL